MASSDANGMVFIWESLDNLLFQTGFVVAPENLISEAKNYLQC
jgi:GntR family transcriptional regulator/MocR family aminotransferase